MLVSVKRKKYGKCKIGTIRPGQTFAGADTGRWFLMTDKNAFVHMETGKLTQLTDRIRRQDCYRVDAIVLRGGEVAANR